MKGSYQFFVYLNLNTFDALYYKYIYSYNIRYGSIQTIRGLHAEGGSGRERVHPVEAGRHLWNQHAHQGTPQIRVPDGGPHGPQQEEQNHHRREANPVGGAGQQRRRQTHRRRPIVQPKMLLCEYPRWSVRQIPNLLLQEGPRRSLHLLHQQLHLDRHLRRQQENVKRSRPKPRRAQQESRVTCQ